MGDRDRKTELFDQVARVGKAMASGRPATDLRADERTDSA
jgi:hypothetical protein